MEDFIIKSSSQTPEVELSKTRSIFRFSGTSLIDASNLFYDKVLQWIKNYATDVNPSTHFDFQFTAVSQASLKSLLFLFQEIKAIELDGHSVSVAWYLDSSNCKMKEIGQDLSYMTDLALDYIVSESKETAELELV